MGTNLDKFFKANSSLEQDGVDFDIGDGISFKVRRFGPSNTRVKSAMATYYKPYAKQVELGTLPVEKSLEINAKVFVDTCLVSWQGVLDESGKPLEFTKENALKLFKDLPDLFETLWKHANTFENYKEELGNS